MASLSSVNSPRSTSPNKRPWCPPAYSDSARQDESGGEGRFVAGSGRTASAGGDGAYVVHPRYRHMFDGAEGSECLDYGSSQRREADRFGGRGRVDANSTGGVRSERTQQFADAQQQGEYSIGFYAEGGQRTKCASEGTRRDGYEREHGDDLRYALRKLQRHPSTRRDNPRDNRQQATTQYGRPSQGKMTDMTTKGEADDRKNPARRSRAIAVSKRLQKDSGKRQMWVKSRGEIAVGATMAPTAGIHRLVSRGSTILSGHEGCVMSLALHEDVLFSSAADGTAKAS